ncbi:hypothetical protein [Polynucleobacter victoriensis]|uniref:Uncharacterized protein n=1 Tax=Polynucleobacter victoriensis TaxID=2049319 RepID=A0A212T7U5_9BURK|nr:hypothetical protein [Polynucleobacter victoriensis]SNC62089.1 hypothetical protein SAMN06295916_0607 [Polynucleobacter victoriensis]
MKYKKWLIISHAYNMDGRASSLTVTDKIPYLLEQGIEPIIISAVTGEKDRHIPHYQLLPWGPSGLRFDFRHWFATKFGRGAAYKICTPIVSIALLPFVIIERVLVGLSSQSSWALPAALKAIFLIKKQRVDLIYSSGGAWSAHYAAWVVKKITKIPWVAEIHDPMVIRVDSYDDGLGACRAKDARFLQRLETLICKDVDYAWWFTNGALSYAKKRNLELGDKGFVIFPGSEPPGCKLPLPLVHQYGDHLNIAHFGSLAADRSLEPVLYALKELFEQFPEAANYIRLNIYGAGLDEISKHAVHKLKMQSIINLHGRVESDPSTGETGRERIMKIMRGCDVLLGLHGKDEWCAEYIPSKLYDYFWTNRPIWGITNRNEELDQMLSVRGGYLSHTQDPKSILRTLQLIWGDWQKKSLKVPLFQPVSPKYAVSQILKKVSDIK